METWDKTKTKNMLKTAVLQNFFFPDRAHVSAARKSFGVEQESKPWLVYAIIAVNGALLLSYLLGVNARASTGYEIRQLENQTQALNETQKSLNLKLSESTAISAMSQDFSQSGFVPAGSPSFITIGNQTTAMK